MMEPVMPDLTATLDQIQMACRTMAKTSHMFFMELIVSGFTRDEAFTQLLLWQTEMYQEDPHDH